jgi:hypothetical protein
VKDFLLSQPEVQKFRWKDTDYVAPGKPKPTPPPLPKKPKKKKAKAKKAKAAEPVEEL